MGDQTLQPQRKPNFNAWKTRDLMLTAALALVFGIVLVGVSYVYDLARGVFTAALSGAVFGGVFCIPGLLTMYILRRPGASLLSQILVGLIQVPFAPSGWASVSIYLLNGLLCELPFLLTRYRNYSLPVFAATGVTVNLVFLATGLVVFGMLNLEPIILIASVLLSILTGIGIGWLSRRIAERLARTGVLANYAIGRTQEEI